MKIDKKYLIGGLVGLGVGAAIGAAVTTVIMTNQKKEVERELDAAEAVLLDLDGDGEPDAVLEDTDGDGLIDTISVDTTGDGEVDTVLLDLDGDGEPDVVYSSNDELLEALDQEEKAEDAPETLEADIFADLEDAPQDTAE